MSLLQCNLLVNRWEQGFRDLAAETMKCHVYLNILEGDIYVLEARQIAHKQWQCSLLHSYPDKANNSALISLSNAKP